MYTEINAALQSVKVLSDWLSANKSLKNYNELATVEYDLREKLMSSLDKQKALIDRISDLEKEISEHNDFIRKVERYTLHELKSGMLVYALKEIAANDEPMHYVCNNCMDNGKLSKLQPLFNGKRFVCQTCKMQVMV
jgi:predicted nuclease with TOPRIM domain